MADELPIVLVLRAPGLNAGAVDTQVQCVNVTSRAYRIEVSSTGFTTIDDDGTLLHHGSVPVQLTLAPGESGPIADVVAWEWDGHVGLFIVFTEVETGQVCRATYNLKHGAGHRPQDPAVGATSGYITPPTTIAPGGPPPAPS
jgi:hypothetical protein